VDGGLPADRIRVKPNFVQPDPGQRGNSSGTYAAYAGRLSPEKGLAPLLSAWKLLGNRVPLVVVGDGPLYADLEKQVREHGLTSISLRGRLPRAEAQAVIKEARFLVLPSECYENFPMGMVESFACGVPVIGSRLGALEELVDDGRTGLHFTAGSPDNLAAKVDWAWANPERMREMGTQARREYESRYTAEQNYPLLMDIYARAIAHQREAQA
jgi:glycosyltransferase involved in cell wall biosynthesis